MARSLARSSIARRVNCFVFKCPDNVSQTIDQDVDFSYCVLYETALYMGPALLRGGGQHYTHYLYIRSCDEGARITCLWRVTTLTPLKRHLYDIGLCANWLWAFVFAQEPLEVCVTNFRSQRPSQEANEAKKSKKVKGAKEKTQARVIFTG